MEPGGGQRWAERLCALQLPDASAHGGRATRILALLTWREGRRNESLFTQIHFDLKGRSFR